MADEVITIRGRRFAVDDCGVCGVTYVVPENVYNHKRDYGGFSHCSNGHQWGWPEGRKQRDELRHERDLLKQDAARLIEEREAALKEAREMKQKYMNVQRRSAAGVCPCCNRTFSNVARHMKTKHPNVVPIDKKSAG